MKYFSNTAGLYRRYRSFAKRNRTYRITNYILTGLGVLYISLLVVPQILFANHVSHKHFDVYSRQPLNNNILRVLDAAEAKLERSPIYNKQLSETLIMSDSFGLYRFMTWSGRSMGSTIPVLGLSRINKSDVDNDLVFADRELPNQRSLSGVIAHETMHNQIREYLGIGRYLATPAWKDEGYCEYIAGETTLSFEEGLRRWKEKPDDPSGYAYFRHRQMVKYLLDVEKIGVDELFNREFDENLVAVKTLSNIDK
jgi:hypothetical protein